MAVDFGTVLTRTRSIVESSPGPHKHAVFLSYSFFDRAVMADVREVLVAAGLTCFFDSGIALRAGEDWRWYLGVKLRGAAAVVGLWSAHSSRSVAVAWEMRQAHAAQKLVIVPVDDTPLPDEQWWTDDATIAEESGQTVWEGMRVRWGD
jgi:hypothetical protein